MEVSGGPSSVFSHPWTRSGETLGLKLPHGISPGKHMYLREAVISPCWNSNVCKYANILTYFIIYRLACWAKVNTQQLSHLHLNFSLLLGNFTLLSHGIYHHCCVYSVCCVPQINLQFWFFTVNAALLTNGSFHTQHYSCWEEWLEERFEAKGRDARPIFWSAFIQSTSIDSLLLTELLLSGNFAWTKNKSSRSISSFWRKDALGKILAQSHIQSAVICSPLPPVGCGGQVGTAWLSHQISQIHIVIQTQFSFRLRFPL